MGSGGPDDNDAQAGRLIVAGTLKSQRGKGGGGIGPEETLVANTLRSNERNTSQGPGNYVTHSLTSEGHDASEDGTGRGTPLVAAPLTKGSATGEGVNQPGRRQEDDVNLVTSITLASDTISADNLAQPSTKRNGDPGVVVGEHMGVRRLTPRECERLQGFPGDWTQLGDTPDSRRYSALGDAVTVNVAEWIGGRLAA